MRDYSQGAEVARDVLHQERVHTARSMAGSETVVGLYRLRYEARGRFNDASISGINIEEQTRHVAQEGLLDAIRENYIQVIRDEDLRKREVVYHAHLNLPYIHDKVIQDKEREISRLGRERIATNAHLDSVTHYKDELFQRVQYLQQPWWRKLWQWYTSRAAS